MYVFFFYLVSLVKFTVKVFFLLQSIKTNKSIGPDGLPNILNECDEALAPSLTTFNNFGLSHGFYLGQ